ncbi:hypothetical protein GCM10029978_034700 [Actinoallomurus acanthiterrae]
MSQGRSRHGGVEGAAALVLAGVGQLGYHLAPTDGRRRVAAVEFVRDGLAKGELTPIIDRTFPLDAIADAYRYLEAGGQVGKIVVTVTQEDGASS